MQSFARPPLTIAAVLDRQDGVHERNWSIIDEAAKGPSSGSRVCRSGATQGQMRILVGDRYDKNRWPPHKRGARRARAHHASTPELAQTKRTVAKTAVQNLHLSSF